MHQAFTVSASTATYYLVASFGLVFLLVFLLKARGATGAGGARAPAPQVPVEA
jgi:hypothetical protein